MPDAAYARARERLQRFLERDGDRIGVSTRTLAFDHGRRTEHATVLFHGLSASPRQLVAIAEGLHARGHNVFVPRLPRHGYRDRHSRALETLDSRQLKACAADALEIAQGFGERVHVAGFSLGGLLSCYAGQIAPVHSALALSPFLGVKFLPASLRALAARLALALPNQFYWWDPILRERQQPDHGYPQYSTHAIAHGLSLADELFARARTEAPAAERLTLVTHRWEPAVNNRAIHKLARLWAASKPGSLEIVKLRGVPMVHDIVEPKRYPALAQRVNAQLVEMIDR